MKIEKFILEPALCQIRHLKVFGLISQYCEVVAFLNTVISFWFLVSGKSVHQGKSGGGGNVCTHIATA